MGYLDKAGLSRAFTKLKTLIDKKVDVHTWSAVSQGGTWSRICHVNCQSNVIGSSFFLNVRGTRSSVVFNATFIVTASHSQQANIIQLQSTTYSPFKIRTLSDSNGSCYVEIYDDVAGIASGTSQTLACTIIPITTGTVTKYTSFTSGATVPSGYAVAKTMTVTAENAIVADSFIGNLSGTNAWVTTVHGSLDGNAATATTATRATKLAATQKGSVTQPVYISSDGVPTATTYTLGKSVPANALFTDTNTWRGIQNNLTSTSTTDSLSAAQGKILNDKFSSYVPTSRTVNGKALSANISLTASDVGASASSHNHDGTYVPTTESGTNAALNRLSTGSSTPTDNDYYIAQYAGGGTTTTTYHRRPVSALWSYIKGKTDGLYQAKGSYAASSHSHSVATASANGFMPSTDKAKLDALGGIVSIQKSITLKTDWQNTGIASDNLSTGTYVVQVSGLSSDDGLSTYSEIWSGVMSWYGSGTNSTESDEIFLHKAGHAPNGNDIYLRTMRNSSGTLALQIAATANASKADAITFKFRKLI